MARIRSVHPGLFTDEAFVSCSALARLLLVGLWTECDDQGVFEWKPLQLKMRLLAADATDATALLDELVAQKLIMRFEVEGRAYGAARNFLRYQRPKSPKPVFPVTPEAMEYVTGNRHGSAVTEGPEPLDFSTDLTAAERKRRQRERDKANNRDAGGNSHGSSVTSTPMSRQMEEGGGRKEKKEKASPSPKKGTRLPADWFLPREWGEWALGQGMSAEVIRAEAEKFRDYWHSVPGQRGVKLDWLATWRNWCRKAMERQPRGNGSRADDRFARIMRNFEPGAEGGPEGDPDVDCGPGSGASRPLLATGTFGG